jgi:hypothetical protein
MLISLLIQKDPYVRMFFKSYELQQFMKVDLVWL